MIAILIPHLLAETLFCTVAACGALLPSVIFRLCIARGASSRFHGETKQHCETSLKVLLWAAYGALLIWVYEYSVSVHSIRDADAASGFRESFALFGDSFEYRLQDNTILHVRRHPADRAIVINDSVQTLTLRPLIYSDARSANTGQSRPREEILPHAVFHFDRDIWLFGPESPPKSISKTRPALQWYPSSPDERYWLAYHSPNPENSTVISRLIPILAGATIAYSIYRLARNRKRNEGETDYSGKVGIG